ncbi:unnamed protein product [Clavelina lepadiformis]|uniref:RING finger protein 37 n=1 Tax=Clavelina lepadiformis TaxID=159417 RepID=A0ABP0FY91_CLALP
MALNFCTSPLQPRISSSCLCADEHGPENLIESAEKRLTKGFQAERFTRTPAFIVVQFPVSVELQKICLKPYIGQQCAKVIQIYVLQHSKNLKEVEMIPENAINYKVGQVCLDLPTQVCFNNQYYKEDNKMPISPQMCKDNVVTNLRGRLYNIIAVKIGIMTMLKGTIPSVSQLSIWGKPSGTCDRNKAQEFISKWMKFKNVENAARHSFYNASASSSTTLCDNQSENVTDFTAGKKAEKSKADNNVPAEFLDSILFTVMENPVLLPSGHTVDQRTLDKHIQTQAEWGRLPSDPFTGILFNEKCKPVSNVFLKLKLDQYLLDKNTTNLSSASEGTCSALEKIPGGEKYPGKRIPSFLHEVRDDEVAPKKQKMCKANLSDPKHFTKFSRQTDTLSTSRMKHKGGVDGSLESALEKVKSNTAKYRIVGRTTPSTDTINCANCHIFLSSSLLQYSLPCQHRFCRKCLMQFQLSKDAVQACPQCNDIYTFKDVARIH